MGGVLAGLPKGVHRPTAGRGASTPASITIRRRIEWADTDAGGDYHYSTALRLAEAAEGALLQELGLGDVSYRTPRVHIEADMAHPLHYGDIVTVHLAVAEVGSTSIQYLYTISRDDEIASKGRVIAVRVNPTTYSPDPWPKDQRDVLLSGGPQRDPLKQ